MNRGQEILLRGRLLDGSDDERRLNDVLIAIGGDILVLMPEGMRWNPEFNRRWILWQLRHGRLIDAPITFKRKTKGNCHQNVATIWRKKQYRIAAICSGYGLSHDGLWRPHTWGILRDGGILETTEVRERYFGLVHEGEFADALADMVLWKKSADSFADMALGTKKG
jgi:hypothetical protein